MKRWPIKFFEEQDGSQPVRAWLDGLPEGVRGKVLARIDLLAEHGPTLDRPYTSQIEGKLREVRLRSGRTRYRVLYFFDEARVGVLLHGFTKNTAAVEETDKKIGRSRMAQHADKRKRGQEKGKGEKGRTL
jgi:phage-related protein